jgi:hypothetical protein
MTQFQGEYRIGYDINRFYPNSNVYNYSYGGDRFSGLNSILNELNKFSTDKYPSNSFVSSKDNLGRVYMFPFYGVWFYLKENNILSYGKFDYSKIDYIESILVGEYSPLNEVRSEIVNEQSNIKEYDAVKKYNGVYSPDTTNNIKKSIPKIKPPVSQVVVKYMKYTMDEIKTNPSLKQKLVIGDTIVSGNNVYLLDNEMKNMILMR